MREYDARLGRMTSIDPRTPEYPWQSPYVYHLNTPIWKIDFLGGGGPDDIPDSEKRKPTKADENSTGGVWAGAGGPTNEDGTTNWGVLANSAADAPGGPHDYEYEQEGLEGFSGVFLNTNEKGIEADDKFIITVDKVVADYKSNVKNDVTNSLGITENAPIVTDPYQDNQPLTLETAARAATYSKIIGLGRDTKTVLKVVNNAYTATVTTIEEAYDGVVDFWSDVGYKTNSAIYNVQNWGF